MPNSQAKTRKQRKHRLNEKWKIEGRTHNQHKKWKAKQSKNAQPSKWGR